MKFSSTGWIGDVHPYALRLKMVDDLKGSGLLKRGMNTNQIQQLLGKPQEILNRNELYNVKGDGVIFWRYALACRSGDMDFRFLQFELNANSVVIDFSEIGK